MPKVRPTHTRAAGGWHLQIAAHDRYVRRAVPRYAATAANLGRVCSDLSASGARMDHGGCPR